jgi:hypothetical protein
MLLDHEVLRPASATVAMDGMQRRSRSRRRLTWAVSGGGTITASGLLAAGSTAGCPFAVTASSGGTRGTVSVTCRRRPSPGVSARSSGSTTEATATRCRRKGGTHLGGDAATRHHGVGLAAPRVVRCRRSKWGPGREGRRGGGDHAGHRPSSRPADGTAVCRSRGQTARLRSRHHRLVAAAPAAVVRRHGGSRDSRFCDEEHRDSSQWATRVSEPLRRLGTSSLSP